MKVSLKVREFEIVKPQSFDLVVQELCMAGRQFLKEDGHIFPVIFGETKDTRLMVLLNFTDQESKVAQCYAVSQFFRDRGVIRYFFITEAWCAVIKGKKGIQKAEGKAVRDMPNKEECIIIEGNYGTGGKTITIPFSRHGKEIVFGKEMVVDGQNEGNLFSVFERRSDDN